MLVTLSSRQPALLQNFAGFVVYCVKKSLRISGATCLDTEKEGVGALWSGIFRPVMPSPPSRTDAHEFMERARERRLIVKS